MTVNHHAQCSWNPSNGGVSNSGPHRYGYCEFIQAKSDIYVLLVVAIVSGALGLVIAGITQCVIKYIICAPTERSEDTKNNTRYEFKPQTAVSVRGIITEKTSK